MPALLRYLLPLACLCLVMTTFAQEAPKGCFIRFRVDALPTGQTKLQVTGYLKIHASPWVTKPFTLFDGEIDRLLGQLFQHLSVIRLRGPIPFALGAN